MCGLVILGQKILRLPNSAILFSYYEERSESKFTGHMFWNFSCLIGKVCRPQWPSGQRRRSVDARLLALRV
jgi:hypothetical protein